MLVRFKTNVKIQFKKSFAITNCKSKRTIYYNWKLLYIFELELKKKLFAIPDYF